MRVHIRLSLLRIHIHSHPLFLPSPSRVHTIRSFCRPILMADAPIIRPLAVEVKLNLPADGLPPSHHVLAPAPGTTLTSYLPHWNPQPAASPTYHQDTDPAASAQDHDDHFSQSISCLPNSIALVNSNKVVRTGFRNPWPSWHKPTVTEVWQGLEWGEDHDPAIDYALEDADFARNGGATSTGLSGISTPYQDSRPASPDPEHGRYSSPSPLISRTISAPQYTRQQKIKIASKQLLTVQEPSFDFDASHEKSKATWLGHAGVLVQLPPLNKHEQPIRILFDPIFSQRCSPTQVAGPIRSYPAPCPISSLPPIDIVMISHNHYDHLDYDTISLLWAANKDRIRFVVPLGNKDWFVGPHPAGADAVDAESTVPSSSTWSLAPSSVTNAATTSNLAIPQDRVTELDWWDEVHLTHPNQDGNLGKVLRVICTPAQHGSGRYGVDTNCALWSSWFVEHPSKTSDGAPTRLFFGGDTGCQFHGRSWPPAPPRNTEVESADATAASESDSITDGATLTDIPRQPTYRGGMRLQESTEEEVYPACPAFEEIVARLGAPNFLMLPISVGATISFLRSYVPLPDSISPFPRISSGLTAANHMPPWDAVGIFDKMTRTKADAEGEEQDAVCMAIHWGTFISGPEEVLKTLGQLKWACNQHGVEFARSHDDQAHGNHKAKGATKTFVALNHGESISL